MNVGILSGKLYLYPMALRSLKNLDLPGFRDNCFAGVGGVVNPTPNPQRGGPGCLFVWDLTLDLSGLGDPGSSYATAGLTLRFIGTRKPHHHDKVETPLAGLFGKLAAINCSL
jgi:hypothetical protein